MRPSVETRAPECSAFAPAQWLRWIGALTFIGAGASFLVEGWTDEGIVKRQALWAAGTLIMTVLGIGVVRRFRDAAGGRVFLGLAAATIPAHFAQLGSALYDLRGSVAGELGSVMIAGVIALLLLPPLALGMSALIRRRGRTLTLLMFLFSAPLVIPSREPVFIALIAGLQVTAWLLLEGTFFKRDVLFRSLEGAAARVMLLAPLAILLVRNGFYGANDVWIATVIACPSAIALIWPKLHERESAPAAVMQMVGVAGLFVALPIYGLPLLPLLLAMSAVLLLGGELIATRPPALAWTAASLYLAAAAVAYAEHGWATSLAIIPLGTVHALAAFRRRSAWLFGTAAVATFAGSIAHLLRLVVLPEHNVWMAGAALGVVLLALASLLESRKSELQRISARLSAHFRMEQSS